MKLKELNLFIAHKSLGIPKVPSDSYVLKVNGIKSKVIHHLAKSNVSRWTVETLIDPINEPGKISKKYNESTLQERITRPGNRIISLLQAVG